MSGEDHQIPVEYIGPRIMVQLRDRAAQLVRHLNNDDVNKVDGMSRIFAVLERSPLVKQLDKHRVDQHRKRLMSLNRVAGESLESYITRGNIYRNQLLGLDSSLEMGEKFYIGHLLDHARLTRRDKALVRTRAGEETEESVTNAMIELAAELEGEHGCPIGASEPNVAGANGEEFLVQRPERNFTGGGGKKFFGKAALGVDMMSQVGDEECDGALARMALTRTSPWRLWRRRRRPTRCITRRSSAWQRSRSSGSTTSKAKHLRRGNGPSRRR